MTTVAEIAAEAFTAVAAELTDVIRSVTITRTTNEDYDPTTGTFASSTASDSGRIVFDTSTPIRDALPGYVAGPGEELVYIEGLDSIEPKENDSLSIVGRGSYRVVQVGNVAGSGGLFAATVVRG
jgi:hypothetical protein